MIWVDAQLPVDRDGYVKLVKVSWVQNITIAPLKNRLSLNFTLWNIERYLESGDSFPVCQFDGITMGCMICYDREYPESARELMLNGAELIMHPNSCGYCMDRRRNRTR